MKLKCPNCNQTNQGFRLFMALNDVDNDGVSSLLAIKPLMGFMCLDTSCRFFGPCDEFEVTG